MKKVFSVLLTVCLCLNALTFVNAAENVSMSDAELPYGKTGGWFTGAENQPKENPAEFIFETPEGTRYSVLDEQDGDFFLLTAKQETGMTMDFDTQTDASVYWMGREGNICTELNKESGTYWSTQLPASLKSYIETKTWLTERRGSSPYKETCKIALLAQHEYVKYWQRFGSGGGTEGDGYAYWVLRTSSGAGGNEIMLINNPGRTVGTATGIAIEYLKSNNQVCYRPCFYIDRAYFANTKLDVAKIGSEVKKMIVAEFERDELSALYSDAELATLGYEAPSVTVTFAKTNGTYMRPGATLTATCNVQATYQWQMSADNETFENISGATEQNYVVEKIVGGNYIRVVATTENGEGVSASQFILLPYGRSTWFEEAATQPKENPVEYLFKTPNGTKFSVLDCVDGDFFLLTATQVKNMTGVADESTGASVYWPERTGNIANKLNDENGTYWTTILDSSVKNYINTHKWMTEARSASITVDEVKEYKIALLAQHEYVKYWDRFGRGGGTQGDGHGWWILRTPYSLSGTQFMMIDAGTPSIQPAAGSASNSLFRPCFYIDRSYFINTKLDVAEIGSEVKKMIVNEFEMEELSSLYSRAELKALGYESGNASADVTVSNATIKGNTTPGYTVSADYTFSDGNGGEEGATTYQWYAASTENGDYAPVSGETAKTYVIRTGHAGKYIKVGITPYAQDGSYGEEVLSSAILVGPALTVGTGYNGKVAGADATQMRYNPTEYLFKTATDGKQFSLLSEENGEYFVLAAENAYGTGTFDPDGTSMFDPTDANNMAYYLNDEAGEFWTTKMDSQVKNYIVEHEWLTEATYANSGNQYVVKSKIAIPAQHEIRTYWSRFGFFGDQSKGFNWWITRTSSDRLADKMLGVTAYNVDYASGYVDAANKASQAIRPCFYLNDDFFKEQKLDLSVTGDYVKKLLRTKYGKETLSKIYTDAELALLGFAEESFGANNLVVAGASCAGQQLTAVYNYYNSNAQATEKDTVYQWYTSDTANGVKVKIDGADTKNYIVKVADIGKYIWVGVTVRDSEGALGYEQFAKTVNKVTTEGEITAILKAVALKNASNADVANVADANKVEMTLNIKSAEASKDVVLLTCFYGGGVLLDCDIKDVTATTNVNDIPHSVNVPEGADEMTIMVWEDMVNIRPFYLY